MNLLRNLFHFNYMHSSQVFQVFINTTKMIIGQEKTAIVVRSRTIIYFFRGLADFIVISSMAGLGQVISEKLKTIRSISSVFQVAHSPLNDTKNGDKF